MSIITRQMYLDGDATHSQYYGQFVTPYYKSMIIGVFGKPALKEAFKKDIHFNTIPLKKWDRLAPFVTANMKEYGDYLTLGGQVSILKEAARQIVDTLN